MKKNIFSKLKNFFILSLLFFSFQTFIGAILGYLFAKKFAGKNPREQGKIKSIIFEFKNWQIHLHHWLICLWISIILLYWQIFPFQYFSLGFLTGAAFQGLTYPDWYKIITRKKERVDNFYEFN